MIIIIVMFILFIRLKLNNFTLKSIHIVNFVYYEFWDSTNVLYGFLSCIALGANARLIINIEYWILLLLLLIITVYLL